MISVGEFLALRFLYDVFTDIFKQKVWMLSICTTLVNERNSIAFAKLSNQSVSRINAPVTISKYHLLMQGCELLPMERTKSLI